MVSAIARATDLSPWAPPMPEQENPVSPQAAMQTFRLETGVTIAQAKPWQAPPVTIGSPALDVMTDLTLVRAATTHPSTSLRQAEQMMIYQGVRMLFVVADMPTFVGLITTTDLHGDRTMRIVNERQLRYDDLSVGDVMTELAMLDAIDYDAMRTAAVGNVVATLQRFGRNHLLVVEDATGTAPRRVRGVISRSQIERQLGEPITITPIATSFSEIERALF
jgi:signal-transduction protein with cAMP-binding, CBS, and nucleotidyltransferase domain